jgi:glutamate-1-semialdehyde 2,1-aminomutase
LTFSNNKSAELFNEAKKFFPGGVNSPVRAFKAVNGQPLFIKRGDGAYLYDEDDNRFIDYVCSWGAIILGHAHPRVKSALQLVIESGSSFGAPTERETTLAKLITSAMPSIEMMRFVSSGTEATMSALRLARAYTGKDKIVKFAGCYHGHSDGLLVKAGSGVTTMSLPDSPGVPHSYTQNTLVASYNDLDSVECLYSDHGNDIAAVIIEPVAANMGVIKPDVGFLQGLRDITHSYGSVLIFDEVITGFRVDLGGAQALYQISPDITCLGKIIGGGLPVGAYGGKKEIMEMIAPSGPVYQAGTLSGNPLAMTAGIETLRILCQPGTYENLEHNAIALESGFSRSAAMFNIPIYTSRVGSILTTFFNNSEVTDYESARSSDTSKYALFFRNMLETGIYLAPSQFEAVFITLAHTRDDIETTLAAAERAFSKMNVNQY